jgi:spore germination protein KB
MQNKVIENISLWQMLTLLVMFETGSSIVIGIGTKARQDSWIAVLIATGIGIGLMWMYNFIIKLGQERDLFEILEWLLGAKLSKVVIMVFVLHFLYLTSFVIRDFGELIVSAVMIQTPVEIISLTLVLLIVYILYLGIEVLARTAEVFTPYYIAFVLLIGVMLFASGNVKIKQIQPVLGEGWGPILHSVFPLLTVFPFGEAVVFMLVLPRTTRPKQWARISMVGILISGLVLTYSTLLQLFSIGPDALGRVNFPLMSAARDIAIANFIERVDALVVFITMLGIVVKSGVLIYGATLGLERTFGVPKRALLLPVGLLVSVSSVLLAKHFGEYTTEGFTFEPVVVELPVCIGIPVLLLLALLWKKRRRKPGEEVPDEDAA